MYTRAGVFYIRRVHGVWHAMLESESLGAFASPTAAHSALITGHVARSASGIDPSKAGLPDLLSAWPYYPKLPSGSV